MARGSTSDDRAKGNRWTVKNILGSFLPNPVDRTGAEGAFKEARDAAMHITDTRFMSSLDEIASRHPILKEEVTAINQMEDECKLRCERQAISDEEQVQRDLRRGLIRKINELSRSSAHKYTLCIDSIEDTGSSYFGGYSYPTSYYRVSGSRESLDEPSLIFTIDLLSITTQDHHNLQLDSTFIPSPHCRISHTFRLPTSHSITHAQLLEGDKMLLIVADSAGNLLIYLERLSAIENAIERGRNKIFHRNKIGQGLILAFDESKGMLAVCASTKVNIHLESIFGTSR
ncbi:hypothetical protein BJ138DRAFT_1195037 [Hygrophoropsis aurantiaca]|uniref:Uncharacterized protein n=1 Tax=Hygrophoropsis aurantiaca TaxID=72124 RepID=A0ACB7ZQ71_9AGAM|nr:hypothetical protein BJ138DRAFT_1195037 [Hygrophoropsis aurantiaca]